jgi:hypothetical protein
MTEPEQCFKLSPNIILIVMLKEYKNPSGGKYILK